MLFCSEPPKLAVTLLAALKVMLQLVVPVHPPDHPAKVSFVIGVAVSVTGVFWAKVKVQTAVVEFEQLIPAGVLTTVPVPAPANATVNPKPAAKLAVTLSFAVIVRLHALVPVQLPLQPTKELVPVAVAVSETWEFAGKLALHVPGQLIPAGVLITVPEPVNATVNPKAAVKLAVTLSFAAMVTLHALVPVQLPLQPLKE
jgi:hypothetical protein